MAVPIFHCYGHKASCQIEYSPKRTKDVGLTDGEGLERLWSYLRSFSRMTKEMGPEKRTDVLTDALIYYGEKLSKKFGKSLKDKLLRSEAMLVDLTRRMKEITELLPFAELGWHEQYVENILEIQNLSPNLVYMDTSLDFQEIERKRKRKEKIISSIEKKHHINCRWKKGEIAFDNAKAQLITKKRCKSLLNLRRLSSERVFLLEMKKKYADGQSIAIKLSNQITKVSRSMKKSLGLVNALGGLSASQLQFDDIKNPQSSCFKSIPFTCDSAGATPYIPQATRKQIIDISCLKERCYEEISLLKNEIIRLVRSNLKEQQILHEHTSSQSEVTNCLLSNGLKALLLAKKALLKKEEAHLGKLWSGLGVSPYTCTEENTEWFSCMNETSANIQVDSESESEGEISELWETDSDLEDEG